MSLKFSDQDKNTSDINAIDKNTYDLLFKLYSAKLLGIALNYLPAKEDAEEVVQDVFLKLWKKKDYLKIESNITGYLYKMTRNACLDVLKHKRNVIHIESYGVYKENILNYNALANDAASNIIEKELEKIIEESIAKLPEKCRKVFIKSRYHRLNHKEISQDMSISTKTVENHITKANKLLKVSLREFLSLF